MGRLGYSSGHRAITGARSPKLRGSGCGRPPPLPNTDPSFPIPGSPHLNFGGTRATKLSADLQRTPAPAAHGAPGEEREGGGEGEGAGLCGGAGGGPWPDTYRLCESSEPPRSPRGRGGGAGRGAALRSGHRRGALRSSRPPRPGPEPESRRRGWPEGGGACSTCPSSPSPRPKLKNNKKQLITPERSASRRGGRRTRRAAPGLSRRRAWLGTGWDAGPGCRGRGSPLLALFGRLLSPPPLHPSSGSAASAAAPRARPGRSSERCPGAAGKTRTGLAAPSHPPFLHLGFPPSSRGLPPRAALATWTPQALKLEPQPLRLPIPASWRSTPRLSSPAHPASPFFCATLQINKINIPHPVCKRCLGMQTHLPGKISRPSAPV